jgi:hypothetical protein
MACRDQSYQYPAADIVRVTQKEKSYAESGPLRRLAFTNQLGLRRKISGG